ncbi:MAG: hypothetical protein LBF61_08885 [Azoarcus sp.]|nr:hypothetical protein [Azoarcus sp.]
MRAKLVFVFLAGPLLLTGGAAAQTRLPAGTPAVLRRDVESIDKYYAEVNKRAGGGKTADGVGATDKGEDEGEAADVAGGTRFTPLAVAPPRTSITPDAPDRDPFEVSPRLREGNARASRFGPQEGMRLNQMLRLRAAVRGPRGGIAKIESGKDVIVVQDGDELDVNNIRYTVTVEADGVMLRGAGAPQYKMLVR